MAIFVDTNVFVYALDEADPAKHKQARLWREALWQSRNGRTSYQVLQEFYFAAVKKFPRKREQARTEVQDLLRWQPAAVDAAMIAGAWRIEERYRLSFWDALIVAAAQGLRCEYLLTEDLQPGQDLEGVQVVSPFLSTPESLGIR